MNAGGTTNPQFVQWITARMAAPIEEDRPLSELTMAAAAAVPETDDDVEPVEERPAAPMTAPLTAPLTPAEAFTQRDPPDPGAPTPILGGDDASMATARRRGRGDDDENPRANLELLEDETTLGCGGNVGSAGPKG